MDWERYKARCDSPEVWSRWMLGQTIELVSGKVPGNDELAAPLRDALAGEPLTKPPGHKGGEATDMFELRLSAAQADAVVAVVRRAVECGDETEGTQGRGLGGFLEAWLKYRRFVLADECQRGAGQSAEESACSPKS